MLDASLNVAQRLSQMAQARPEAVAVVEPLRYDARGKRLYRKATFRELDRDSDRIAGGLRRLGVSPGTRLALLAPAGIDFVSLVFGLYKAGAVAILIDPGMGRRNLIRCLAEAEPEGFVAVPLAQAIRSILPGSFPKARFNVTIGRRLFWSGVTLKQLRQGDSAFDSSHVLTADDPAAIIFTTGSTGPSKGVLYTHGNFNAQVEQIRDFFDIRPGEVDLSCFPLFGLFNCAMGVTAVIPDMDPSRPAQVDPAKIVEAVRDWNVTQAFGSPAIWDSVGRHCEKHSIRLPMLRRVLSSGAPVSEEVLRRMTACIHPEGDMHTPYGATEALPTASISAREVLGSGDCPNFRVDSGSTSHTDQADAKMGLSSSVSQSSTIEQTRRGAGVCVGRRFSGIQWKVIRIVDGPIASIDQVESLLAGEIGELIVRGPQVTRRYVTRVESNALAKIADGAGFWHRMGDSGYLDELDRFWFCGRVAHCVRTSADPMYPVRCEAIFNRHPAIRRSALVGVGPPGSQRPVIVLEPNQGQMPRDRKARRRLLAEIRELGAANPLTADISAFLLHPGFPVDIRHNAKIFREKLALWAARQV